MRQTVFLASRAYFVGNMKQNSNVSSGFYVKHYFFEKVLTTVPVQLPIVRSSKDSQLFPIC